MLATLTPACFNNSLWTTLPLRNVWSLLPEFNHTKSTLILLRNVLVTCSLSQNTNTRDRLHNILVVNTEHGLSHPQPPLASLLSLSHGLTKMFTPSTLWTLSSAQQPHLAQVALVKECTAVQSQTLWQETISLILLLALTAISLTQVFSAWQSKDPVHTHKNSLVY